MKKNLLLIALLCITSFAVGQNFDGGFLVGFNGSQLDGDGFRGYNKLGLVMGVWIQNDVSETKFWGAELEYSQKGSRKNPTRLNPDQFIYRVNYIDLPVFAGYRYTPYLSFVGGISFNYLINSSASSYMAEDIEGFDFLDKWELGLLMGIKVDLIQLVDRHWAEKFKLDLRFNYSLLSIYDTPEIFSMYRRGLYNNSISTVLYYQIDWGNNNK